MATVKDMHLINFCCLLFNVHQDLNQIYIIKMEDEIIDADTPGELLGDIMGRTPFYSINDLREFARSEYGNIAVDALEWARRLMPQNQGTVAVRGVSYNITSLTEKMRITADSTAVDQAIGLLCLFIEEVIIRPGWTENVSEGTPQCSIIEFYVRNSVFRNKEKMTVICYCLECVGLCENSSKKETRHPNSVVLKLPKEVVSASDYKDTTTDILRTLGILGNMGKLGPFEFTGTQSHCVLDVGHIRRLFGSMVVSMLYGQNKALSKNKPTPLNPPIAPRQPFTPPPPNNTLIVDERYRGLITQLDDSLAPNGIEAIIPVRLKLSEAVVIAYIRDTFLTGDRAVSIIKDAVNQKFLSTPQHTNALTNENAALRRHISILNDELEVMRRLVDIANNKAKDTSFFMKGFK